MSVLYTCEITGGIEYNIEIPGKRDLDDDALVKANDDACDDILQTVIKDLTKAVQADIKSYLGDDTVILTFRDSDSEVSDYSSISIDYDLEVGSPLSKEQASHIIHSISELGEFKADNDIEVQGRSLGRSHSPYYPDDGGPEEFEEWDATIHALLTVEDCFLTEEDDISENLSSMTEARKRKRKKATRKALGWFQRFSGDPEKESEFFNKVNTPTDNLSTNPTGPMGDNGNSSVGATTSSGMGEGYKKPREIPKSKHRLDETSIGRIRQHLENAYEDVAIISPYRSVTEKEKKIPGIYEKRAKENKENMLLLKQEVNDMGYGFTELTARWVERDADTGENVSSDEKSLFIPEMPFDVAFDLGHRYNQSSIIIKDQDGCREVCTNEFESFDEPSITYYPYDVVRTFKVGKDDKLNIDEAEKIFAKQLQGPASKMVKGSNPKAFKLSEVYVEEGVRPSYFNTSGRKTHVLTNLEALRLLDDESDVEGGIKESYDDIESPDLKRAYDGSWYTIVGCGGDLNEWKEGYQGFLDDYDIGKIKEWITFKGRDVNQEFNLTGDNAYDNDLTFLAFPLDGLNVSKLSILKLKLQDRWFDDLVDNSVDNDEENEE